MPAECACSQAVAALQREVAELRGRLAEQRDLLAAVVARVSPSMSAEHVASMSGDMVSSVSAMSSDRSGGGRGGRSANAIRCAKYRESQRKKKTLPHPPPDTAEHVASMSADTVGEVAADTLRAAGWRRLDDGRWRSRSGREATGAEALAWLREADRSIARASPPPPPPPVVPVAEIDPCLADEGHWARRWDALCAGRGEIRQWGQTTTAQRGLIARVLRETGMRTSGHLDRLLRRVAAWPVARGEVPPSDGARPWVITPRALLASGERDKEGKGLALRILERPDLAAADAEPVRCSAPACESPAVAGYRIDTVLQGAGALCRDHDLALHAWHGMDAETLDSRVPTPEAWAALVASWLRGERPEPQPQPEESVAPLHPVPLRVVTQPPAPEPQPAVSAPPSAPPVPCAVPECTSHAVGRSGVCMRHTLARLSDRMCAV